MIQEAGHDAESVPLPSGSSLSAPGFSGAPEILPPTDDAHRSGIADDQIGKTRNLMLHPALTRRARTNGFTSGPRTLAFRKAHYPDIPDALWNDWRWQLRNRLTSLEALARVLRLSEDESAARSAGLPLAVTPYYASLMEADDPSHGLRRTMVPVCAENLLGPGESADPLGEDGHSPVPSIVHRYPDRALFLATNYCAAYCRYCTRSRRVGKTAATTGTRKNWEAALAYIEANPAIRDVLISGGDPLTLSDAALEYLLGRIRAISHVEIIRIGTKAPMVLPQRITPHLARVLSRFHPLFISVHAAHPDELTPESTLALGRLASAGIPLGSQTVLLEGVNNNIATMTRLMHGLLKTRVRPYYLYHCDPVQGTAHFRTPVTSGLEMIRGLRGHTSGYAVPTFVVDAPGGGGKIPLMPDYVAGRDGDDLLLTNFENHVYKTHDPAGTLLGPAAL